MHSFVGRRGARPGQARTRPDLEEVSGLLVACLPGRRNSWGSGCWGRSHRPRCALGAAGRGAVTRTSPADAHGALRFGELLTPPAPRRDPAPLTTWPCLTPPVLPVPSAAAERSRHHAGGICHCLVSASAVAAEMKDFLVHEWERLPDQSRVWPQPWEFWAAQLCASCFSRAGSCCSTFSFAPSQPPAAAAPGRGRSCPRSSAALHPLQMTQSPASTPAPQKAGIHSGFLPGFVSPAATRGPAEQVPGTSLRSEVGELPGQRRVRGLGAGREPRWTGGADRGGRPAGRNVFVARGTKGLSNLLKRSPLLQPRL